MRAVQTLDISPVGRVEGDLDVRVDMQDGVVVNAWTQAELFRGFEVILRDKDPQAGLVVTPRACGICGASHLTCAAWALDTAWQTEVPRNAILARNLGPDRREPAEPAALLLRAVRDRPHQQEIRAVASSTRRRCRRFAPFTGTSLRDRRHHLRQAGRDLRAARRAVAALELHGAGRRHVRADPHRRHPRLVDPRVLPTQLARADLARLLARALRGDQDLRRLHGVAGREPGARRIPTSGFFWRMGAGHRPRQIRRRHRPLHLAGAICRTRTSTRSPTIEGRNAALIMKSGVYDGATRHAHARCTQAKTRENMTHAWYDEGTGDVHPYDRTTRPRAEERPPTSTAHIPGRPPCSHSRGRAPRSRAARAPDGGRRHGTAKTGSTTTRSSSTCIKKMGGPSLHPAPVRAHARDGQALPRGRALPARVPAERPVVHQADGAGRPRLGRDRGDSRRAVPLDRSQGRQDQELPDRRADHLERRAPRRQGRCAVRSRRR